MSPRTLLLLVGAVLLTVGGSLIALTVGDKTDPSQWVALRGELVEATLTDAADSGARFTIRLAEEDDTFSVRDHLEERPDLQARFEKMLVVGEEAAVWCTKGWDSDSGLVRPAHRVEVGPKLVYDQLTEEGGGPIPWVIGVFGAIIGFGGVVLILIGLFASRGHAEEPAAA